MRRTWIAHVALLLSLVNPSATTTVATTSLVGCGAIARPSRLFPYSPGNYDFASNTPGICMQACSASGYAYASVSAGRFCFCGSASANISLLNTTSTTLCQVISCAGDGTVYCGDTDYELVYTSIGVIDSASIALNGGGSPMALLVNQVYQFNLAYQGAVSVINYQVDFGDGTTTGWFGGTVNTTTTISNVFSRAGEFSISVAARSVAGMLPTLTAMAVKVSDQISALDVSIVCPNLTVTAKTISCVLTSVRGTDLTGLFTYNTTAGLHSISAIPDAQYNTYGSPSVTYYPTVDSSVSSQTGTDMVILPQSTVQVAGRVASIQFYASAAGTITISLLRPVCTSPAIYCYNTNMCGSCAAPYTLQCSTSVYSTISRACVNATASQRVQPSVYGGNQFQVVAQWTFVSSGAGYVQITANSTSAMANHTAMVGDFLGFQGSFIGKEVSTDGTTDYRCISPGVVTTTFTCTVGNLSSNGTNYHYFLQATIIEAIQIAPVIMYNDAGNFNVQGTVTQRNVTSFSTSTILPVLYGIDWVAVVGPASVSAGVPVTFTANIYPPNATATIFIWSLNGVNLLNSTSNTLNTSFPLIGTYTIGCQAQNLLSAKANTTTILVQDVITNLTLHAGNITNVSTSQPLETAEFQLRMASGSNYACRVNFDTSQTTTQVYFYTYGYIPGSYFTHQYLQEGAYNVQVYCANSASNVSYSFVHYVQYPITGLLLQQHGTTKNTNYQLNFTIAQGSSPQFRILINGTQVNYTYYAQYNLIQTISFNGQPSSFNMSVQIYAWNYLSSSYLSDMFSVVSPIVNPQVQSSVANTSFPGPILFQYTMDSGSQTQVTFSFGDTLVDNPIVCQYSGDYPANQWSQCTGTNHTFQIPGTITVIVAFSNAISTIYKYITVTLTTSVQPIEVVTDLQIPSQQCSAAFIDTRAVASFMIQSKNASSKPASNAQVIIIPDAVNQPTISQGPFQLSLDYFASPSVTSTGLNVIYTSLGTYTAVFQVSNSIDTANISCLVHVVPVLQQVYYSLNPPNWPLSNSTPFQASVFIGDPNPGPVTITWDFGDGTVLSGARTATQYFQADTRSHSYSAVGTYTLTITVQGSVNIVVESFPVIVEYPVTAFTVTTPSLVGSPSQIAYTGSSVTVTFTVVDSSSPPASNAVLLVDYNDTSPLATNSVINVSLPFTGSYTYISPGIFLVNMTVYNDVSSITQIITVAINAPFNGYSFTLCYLLPGYTSPLSDTCSLTTTGGRYYLPKQSELVAYVTWSNPSGVPETFDVQFRSGLTVVFTQALTVCQTTNVSELVGTTAGAPLFRLVVDLENNLLLPDGPYRVTVVTRNPSYSASYSLNVYIVSMVAGLSISDGGILLPMNVPKTFTATYEYFSSLSCLYIQYSDKGIDCFGDSSTCSALPSDRPSLKACPSAVQAFNSINASIVFTRAFNTSRSWLYGYAWNSVTRASASTFFAFPSGMANCGLPSIVFAIPSPVISGARQVQRSQAFSVAARTALNCSTSLNNTKQWSILLCDTITEQCVSTSALNRLIAQVPSATTSEVFLTARSLSIGTYLFNYTVTMNSLSSFSTWDYTYVTIIASDIQVNLLANGTSAITSGVAQSLLFQPGAYTVDPDSSFFDPSQWTFDYYCRLYGVASYPTSDGTELTIESTIVDPLNPSCFDTPGNTSYYKYGPNSNRSILYVQPRTLQAARPYEFKVVLTNIYDTTRQYTGFAVVQVQDIDSVLVAVECVIHMCSDNVEYQRIDSTTQALLTSHCLQTCDGASNIVIQWSIYRGFQTGYPNNDVQWILYTNMSGGDNSLFFGRNSQNFTATSALFQNNPTITYWKFQATYIVTTSTAVAAGTGAIRFVINSPPANGTCTIDRTTGTTRTLFQLSCTNWADTDGIQDYTFYITTSSSSSRTLVGFTTSNDFGLFLPIGDPTVNYTLQLTADIQDTYGAVVTFTVGTITIAPDNGTLLNFIQIAQQAATQGRGSDAIEQTLYGGDQNLVCQTVMSLSQALNWISANLQQSAAAGNIPLQNIQVSGLTTTSSTYPTTNTSGNTSLAMSAYTADLNTNAVVRDYAIQFMSNLTVTTVDSIKLQASVITQLTNVPNELTRQAVNFAGQKCEDLVNSLNGMVQTVSYEDAQSAVNSIAQLASNVLVAVNAPLLGRGSVIHLDYDRANTLPPDYETDLESPWSNPNLFADGDDFSVDTLERNRNLYYQQQGSNQVINQVDDALSKAVNILSYHMNTGQTNTINTPSIAMTTKKVQMSDLNSMVISAASGAQIQLPVLSYCNLTTQIQPCSASTPITLNSIVLPLATAGYNGRSQVYVNMSRSVSLNLLTTTGLSISLNNIPSPIVITIPRDSNLLLPAMTLQNVTGTSVSTVGANNNRQFSLYYVNVTSPSGNITLSATFELQSDNSALGYMMIFRFDAIPILNSSMSQIDGSQVLCPGDRILTTSNGYIYSYLLDNTRTVGRQYAMFGIRELSSRELAAYCANNGSLSNTTTPICDQTANYSANYHIRAFTSGCYYLDQNMYWQSLGVVVGSSTNHGQTQCSTSHLTTFAGGWIVLPAPINWNYVFSNLDFSKNKTIYLTVILLVVFYIVFMIYARYKDKTDVEKLGVTPLPDNMANDKYYYQIIVFTGLRKDAGTSSKVFFIMAGDDDETGTRTFEDPSRKVLRRGGIDSFIMAVPKSLGRLNYMRVWHDNSGTGANASWFLKYIVVRDLQTMAKNHFICQKWLAVEHDDGMVDRLLPVAGELQKTEFAYLLSKKTYHSLSDGHLWFSVFSRPPSTRFTRTQRCTCCFVLLFMSMLLNIMYYDQNKQAQSRTASGFSIGPFYVTPEQIAIGIIVELICFLPSTILVEMFRRLRLRRRPKSPVREALRRMQEDQKHKQQQATLNDIHPHLSNYIVNSDPSLSSHELNVMRNTLASPLPAGSSPYRVNQGDTNWKKKKKKTKHTLPWWFIFVAYGLSALVFGVSTLFIIARGIEFGDDKTRQWLVSSITGFFSSILLTQPLKVVCMAIFFALVFRQDDDEEISHHEDDDDMFLDSDEEYLHNMQDGSLLTFRSKTGHIPLTEGEVAYARDRRLKQIRMWEIIRELLAYCSFLWVLYVVSYSNRDPNGFYLMKHLKQDLLNLNNATYDFTQIYRDDQYWDWLTANFVPRIRAANWYNDDKPTNLSGYIADKTNRILGWATMRQLRVLPNSCKILSAFQTLIPGCEASYSVLNEDRRSFYPGWTSEFNTTLGLMTNYSAAINQAFLYRTSDSLDTYSYVGEHATYGAGGYVFDFRGKMSDMLSNVSALKQLSWLDSETRAVIIQMSLYNPNVNLFVFVTILVEFIPAGGVYPSARVEPFSLLTDYAGFAVFKLICSILYMVFIGFYMLREIRSLIKNRLGYFHDFWSYPELGIIGCSWAGLGMYVWRVHEGNRVGDLFKKTNGYAYVNLQLAAYVDDVLTFLLGFCCFFGTFKFLRLLRFNHRMSLLSSTLAYAAKDLLAFTCMFSVIYLGYLALFFLLFHAKIWACSDPLKTAQMLFEMMLLKFNVSDLNAADAFLGPFCFSMFIIFVVFICMNMFISIIADSFRVVRHNVSLQHSEHEIAGFMFNQFKKWTGFGRTREMDQLHVNPYDGSRVQYNDPVTSFPDKMDELISALNKIYMDTKRNDTVMFQPMANEKPDDEGRSASQAYKRSK